MLDELSSVAFANAADFVEITGEGRVRVKPTARIPKRKRAAMIGIRAASGGVEIKLANKMQALQMLGRYLGAFACRLVDGRTASFDLSPAKLKAQVAEIVIGDFGLPELVPAEFGGTMEYNW